MKARATKLERDHMAWIAGEVCCACGRYGVNVHHVVSDGYKRLTKDNLRVIPLCPHCHTDGPYAVHKVSYDTFRNMFGVDQMSLAEEFCRASPKAAEIRAMKAERNGDD